MEDADVQEPQDKRIRSDAAASSRPASSSSGAANAPDPQTNAAPDTDECMARVGVAPPARQWGLQPGWVLDLTTHDPSGKSWDFSKTECRRRCRQLVQETRPKVLINSTACAALLNLQQLNAGRSDPAASRRLRVESEMHLAFCCELYEMQIKRGDYFLHEHPAGTGSWQCTCIQRLMAIPGVLATVADQCCYGLAAIDDDGPGLVRKTTKFLTNPPCVAKELRRRCIGGHKHARHVHGREVAAQVFPAELRAAVRRGIRRQIASRLVTRSRDERELKLMVESDAVEGNIRREGLGVGEISSLVHQGEACWDDVKGGWLDPSQVRQARQEEMAFVKKMQVYDKVPREECVGKPISVRWVDANKGTDSEPNYRSRVVAQELRSRHHGDPSDLYAAMPPLEAMKYIISHVASDGERRRELMVIDIRRAYFNAPARRPVYVEIPPEDWVEGDERRCARLRSSLYGTRDAARNWEEELRKFIVQLGAKVGRSTPCVYYFKERRLCACVHGDDVVCSGRREDLQWFRAQFEKRFEIRYQHLSGRLGGSREVKILNRTVRWTSRGIAIEADPRHVREVIRHLGLEGSKGVRTPCEVERDGRRARGCENLEPEESVALSYEDARRYRGIAARLNYLAQDRPDLKFPALRASRSMSEPHEKDWQVLKRVGRYLISRPRAACLYKWQSAPCDVWSCSASDWAGDKASMKSTIGGCLWHGAHLLKVWSKTQAAISLSSAEAELYAAVHCAAEALGLQSLMKDLSGDAKIHLGMDASAALGMINRQGLGKARHVETQWLWIQQAAREGRIQVTKIPGAENPADLMTKPLGSDAIDRYMKKLGYEFVELT